MPVEIVLGETDDPYFIAILNSLVRGLIDRGSPSELWIVQIDNWFDHKWLRFSGIGSVHFQFPAYMNRIDAALDEFYQDRVTFPPFTPNRIMSQWSFQRVGDHYAEAPSLTVPYRSDKRPSEANLQRRVQDFGRSACFVWYSANTVANGRASVMVYDLPGNRVECWFAAFNRRNVWKLQVTKGVSRHDVVQLMTAAS